MTSKKRGATRVMYMHTLDGKPANFTWTREQRGDEIVEVPYVYFAGARRPAELVPSLRQLKREQRMALEDAKAMGVMEWSNPRTYGYVRVNLPAPLSDLSENPTNG